MHDLVEPLTRSAFSLFGAPVSWAELLGFATGLAAVALAARRHPATFPVGLANAVFFVVLFADERLFADAGLQVAFAVLMLWGWWTWLHGGPGRAELPVTRATPRLLLGTLLGIAALTALLVPVLREAHGAAPFWDALGTATSIGAQVLLNLKKLESWWLWIAVDLLYVPLFLSRDLVLTAVVYCVFLGICIGALRGWRRELAGADQPVAVPAGRAVVA